MSLFKKFSNVMKEVFWIKPSPTRKSSKKKSKAFKKIVKKTPKKTVKSHLKKPVLAAKATVIKKLPVTKPTHVLKASKSLPVKKPKKVELDANLMKVGDITHYFDRIKVSVVKITSGTILVGDKLTIVGEKSKFMTKVWSMQIESVDVKVAKKGQIIGLKVEKPVTVGDVVYKTNI